MLFPVKRPGKVCLGDARRAARRALGRAAAVGVLLLGSVGCGYTPIYGQGGVDALCVTAAPSRIPDIGAVQAALHGARRELARANALAASSEGPCLVVELLRVEEAPTGVRAERVGDRELPRAMGSEVRVTGRGWVREMGTGAVSRDTGDMSRRAQAAFDPVPAVDAEQHRRLVEAAAEALGAAIARRVLGLPEVSH